MTDANWAPLPDWPDWREEFLRFVQDDVGIANATEYVRNYGNTENIDDRPELEKILSDVSLEMAPFERVFPANDQNIATVMINPKLDWSDPPDRDDNYLMSLQDLNDFEARIDISSNTLGWLNDRGGATKGDRIQKAVQDTNYIGKAFEKPFGTDFFSDVYYTSWFKFATKEGGAIPIADSDIETVFPSKILRSELEQIAPELVLVFGRQPWGALYQFCKSVKNDVPCDKNINNVRGNAYRYSRNKTSFYIIPFNFRYASEDTLNSALLQIPAT